MPIHTTDAEHRLAMMIRRVVGLSRKFDTTDIDIETIDLWDDTGRVAYVGPEDDEEFLTCDPKDVVPIPYE